MPFLRTSITFGFTMSLSLLIVSFSFLAVPLAAQQQSPGQLVVEKIEESLKVLNDPELKVKGRLEERKEKLWKILGPVFNFEEISKRALGRHWKERSQQEKQEFTELFTKILKEVFLGKSDTYQGEKIIYLKELVQGNRSRVQTSFITREEKEIAVTFSMINKNGNWQIYDILIEGVSTVGNYRSQFNSILTKSPFSELMNTLKEKELEFST